MCADVMFLQMVSLYMRVQDRRVQDTKSSRRRRRKWMFDVRRVIRERRLRQWYTRTRLAKGATLQIPLALKYGMDAKVSVEAKLAAKSPLLVQDLPRLDGRSHRLLNRRPVLKLECQH